MKQKNMFLMALLLQLFTSVSAWADDLYGSAFTYNYEGVTYGVNFTEREAYAYGLSDSKNMTDVRIQSFSLTGSYIITEIFHKSSSTILSINDEVVDPDQTYTFYPKMVLQGFSGSAVTSVQMDNTVTIVQGEAFKECTDLKSIQLSSGLSIITVDCFRGCTSLTTIDIPDNVTQIAFNAFTDCTGLTSITLSENLELIDKGAFSGCSSLKSIVLPNSLSKVGLSVFVDCTSLESVVISDNLKEIGQTMFMSCEKLSSVIFGENSQLETIGMLAFCDCSSLKEFYMPDKLATLVSDDFNGSSPFGNSSYEYDGCPIERLRISDAMSASNLKRLLTEISGTLTTVSFGKSPTVQNLDMLKGLEKLQSVEIPASVTSLTDKTFYHAQNLKEIHSDIVSPFAITDDVFNSGTYNTATLHVPAGSKALYEKAEGWKNFKNITDGTEVVDEVIATMNTNQGLIEVAREQGWIPENATQMTKAEAEKVADIGTVFKENNSITSLDELRFFTGLTKIEAEAFFSSSITSVILPETVTEIGAGAFRFSGLKSITLPAALTTVGEMAFYNCYLLMEVTSLNPNPTAMPDLEFYTNDATLYVPSGTKALYEAADGWKLLTHIVDPAEGEQVFESGGLKYYKLADGSVCVIDGQHVSGECSIPATVSHGVTDYPVSMISCGAFSGNKALTSVVIPDGVTNIGSFESCSNLVTATLPKSIASIDMFREFWDCSSLVSLDIPEGVTEFEESAFSRCVSLTSVTLPKSLKKSHRYAFENCEKLSDVHILDVSLWSSINFGYGNRDSGPIPTSNPLRYAKNIYLDQDRVPSAKHDNFGDVSAKTLYVLKGCKEAYQNADFWKDFGEIKEMEGETSSVIVAFADANVEAICVANWDTDGDGEFSFAEAAAVTDIGERFKGTDISSFDEFQFFEGITTIPQDAFNECRELTSIKLPKTVTSIGNYAFCYCGKLTSITIPAAVVSIGAYEFEYCNSLSEMIVEEGNAVYDSRNDCNAIIYTPSNMLLYGCKNTVVPEDVVNISSYAFYAIETLESIHIPASVMIVSGRSFDGCSSLSAISVSKDNTVFDSRDNCNAIVKTGTNELIAGCNNTVIPKDVVSIQTFAFSGRSVGKVTVPGNVKTIADYAFNMCPALTEVEFEEGLAEIGENAFQSCDALETVSLPSTVTTIKSRAFISAPLKFVMSMIPIPFELPNDALSSYRYDTAVLYVPVGTKSLYEQAEGWKNFKTIEEIVLMPMKDMSVVDFGEDGNLNENTDLGGTVIDNVYFNISPDNGGYDATDNSVVVSKPMTDEEIAAVFGNDQKDLFSDEVKNNFAGMVVEVPAGKGVVTVEAQTTGGLTLKVKIGNADSVEVEFEGKLKLKFPYDVTEPTYAYIFAGETQASVRARTRGETPSLRIYGISVNRNVIPGDANGDGVVNYSDVVAVLDRIIGGTSGKFVEAAADVNNDGQITIADALGIVDIITKKQ